ncbi:hypothetical protein [Paenibacillus monticola]|uniref:hypothetical protein n=1 Tax=Paenibacillus monticola TaxID=2666075 RepID=UPI0012ACBF76|nr:hypothetical protein [Paenibacillus monticola]
MKVKEVQAVLKAGERFFVDWALPETVEVLAWGMAWVRYKTPSMKFFISTNIRTFSMGIDSVYKQEGECSSGGGGANGVLPECDSNRQGGDKSIIKKIPQNGQENRSLREKGVVDRA